MSENENRPRRAMDPDEELDLEDPNGPDDTPADQPSPARRGADPEEADDASDRVDEDPATGHESPGSDEAADAVGEPSADQPVNPFARPGSESASLPVSGSSAPRSTSPVLPEWEGRRAGGFSDDSQPVPRRSAVSSTTPPELDVMIPAPPAGTAPPAPPAAGPGNGGGSWFEHHRRTLTLWAVGAVVAALVIGLGFYFVRRSAIPEPTETTDPTNSQPESGSPSASESPDPEASVDDLMSVEDADLMVPGASWVVTETAEERSAFQGVTTCLSTDDGPVNTLTSLQRTLGTSDADHLAALHQIDVYANVEAAQQVQATRLTQLAACDRVPVHIISSTAVTGLADEVSQLTVAYQNSPQEVHSVWLIRTGRTLTTVDVVRDSTGVDPSAVASGVVRSLGQICEASEGTCPTTPAFSPTLPPSSTPAGWLLTGDLPRITLGTGQWTTTDPGPLTSTGMGCENIPLATEPGPAGRQQRTYLLIQDANRPETFGVDEMLFDFNTPEDAAAFVGKLGGNLASCKDRVLTATVTEHQPGATGTGADGVAISGRIFTIQQATSDTSSVIYQLVVTIAGNKVSYLLSSVTEEFKFSDAQLLGIALRSGERLSQA